MALPLGLVLSPMFLGLARILTGAAVAGGVYAFISLTVMPAFSSMAVQTTSASLNLTGFSPLLDFFDFAHLISLILSAYAAAFSVKLALKAIQAFSVKSS